MTTELKTHLIFDTELSKDSARSFLTECSKTKNAIKVQSTSPMRPVAETQRASLLRGTLAEAEKVIVLVTPRAANCRALLEEIRIADDLGKPMIGVLIGGATTSTELPKGLPRGRVVGFDWGAITRAMKK